VGLIERKILEVISRKNSSLTMPRRIDGNKTKDHTAVLQSPGPRTAVRVAVRGCMADHAPLRLARNYDFSAFLY